MSTYYEDVWRCPSSNTPPDWNWSTWQTGRPWWNEDPIQAPGLGKIEFRSTTTTNSFDGMTRVGACSLCGGDVVGHRGAWWSVSHPPEDKCSSCGAVRADSVIEMMKPWKRDHGAGGIARTGSKTCAPTPNITYTNYPTPNFTHTANRNQNSRD